MGSVDTERSIGGRFEAVAGGARSWLQKGGRRVWVAALIVALLAWPLGFGVPTTGLDASWMSGLYIGIHGGKDFGKEIVFTYGPLGFLDWPMLWFSWLAVLALLFSAAIYLAFVITLTALLKRTIGLAAAAIVVFLYMATIPDMEQLPLVLAVAWALMALGKNRPDFALTLLVVGGGSLSALECLIKLSVGPVVFLICLLGVAGARASRRQWGLFGGFSIGGLIALWLIAGQSLGSLWDYGKNGAQVIAGYNEAMGIGGAPGWAEAALVLLAVVLVVCATRAGLRDARARWFAAALLAIAAFSSYKYGIVRFEPAHVSLALSAMLGIWLVMPWPQTRAPAFLTAAAVIGALMLHVFPTAPRLDVIRNVKSFGTAVELVARPGLRQGMVNESRASMQAAFDLDPETLAQLQGKRVTVDPWEISVAWAYELDWSPLPVIQNYTAYTQSLDRLNAAAVEDPDGPQVILRQNPGEIAPLGGTRSFQGRQPAWDPPEQNFAVLCNFAPTRTAELWQVLSRVPERCGRQKLISRATAQPGEAVTVPQAGRDEVVLMRLQGAEIEGFERLRSLLFRPKIRTAVLNGGLVNYQLVPGTTDDGMVVSRDPKLDGSGAFVQFPEVKNIGIEGVSRTLHFSFYRVKVRPAAGEG